ncbi:MAG: hypothetical protein HY22_10375 [[Candidatus Thermochlorobacteriaceae] bacterium GBChlB]|nr:MAG: hypothetical protein HY22_10375 [[Candidatus Thermochlorobacteriaceae] bacterium GBChlB]
MTKRHNAAFLTQLPLRRCLFVFFLIFQVALAADAVAQTTWYSRTDVTSSNFNVTTAWTDSPSGTGGSDPAASVFTSGTDNFVVLASRTRTINATTTINSLTVNAGGTLNSTGAGVLNLNGNLTANEAISLNVSSSVNFVGSSSATIGGSNNINFGNLTINKTSGTVSSGTNSIAVRSVFSIQSNFTAGTGIITLNDADLNISGGTANFSAGSISVIGTIGNFIETNQDITLTNFTLSKGTDPSAVTFTLQSDNATARVFTITGTFTRTAGALAVGAPSQPAELRYSGDASTLSYSGSPGDDVAIGPEFVTAPGFGPRNLTINVTTTVVSSSSYTIERNLTLTSGTIDLGANTLTVNGNITGSTISPGAAVIADATTLNLGGGSTTTREQTIAAGSIVLNKLVIDKQFGASPADTEDPRNTVNADGAFSFTANGVLTITSGTLRFLTDGRLAGANLGTLTINIGSASRRGVLRTGGTDITTSVVGVVNASFGTNGVNSKVIYDGSTGTGNMRTGSFGLIEVNRNTTVLSGTTSVQSELIFRSGVIGGTSGSNVLRLLNGSTVSYVGSATAQTSFVSGPVQRQFTAAGAGDFPVGKSSGGNRVTFNFTSLSPSTDLTVEQFNANPGGSSFPTGIGAVSPTRYWTAAFTGSPSVAYSIQVDIAGSGIPSPLNRVLFATSGSPGSPTYGASGFPGGANEPDNGSRTVNSGSPFTLTAYGATPNFFTLGESNADQIIAVQTGDWNTNSTWNLGRPPLATENVRFQGAGITVTVSGAGPQPVANSITTNVAGNLILNRSGTPIEVGGVGQWIASRTSFTQGFVEYQQGNVYGDSYNDLRVNNTAAVGTQNSSDGVATITVAGDFTKQGTGAFTSAATNTISVAGSYTNTAGNATYTGALSVAGNATVTAGDIGGSATVSGSTLTMNGGSFNVASGTLTLNNTSGITINGTLTSPEFANLNLIIGTGSVTLGGSVTTLDVNGNLLLDDAGTGGGDVTNGTILMSGTAAQTISGVPGDIGKINNLTINNAAGVTLNRALTVSGTLTMTNGLLNTTVTNLLTTASTSGGSASSYVNGPLAIGGTGSSSPKVYPIGKGTTFRPVELTTSSPTTVQRMELFNLDPRGVPSAPLLALSIFRYWQGTNIQTSDQIRLSYDAPNDGIITPNTNLRVASSTTGVGGSNAFSDRGSNAVGTPLLGATSVQSAALPASPQQFFTFGSLNLADAPLPVELVSFIGTGSRKGIELSWRTGSERESFGFVVNRRRAGGNWEVLDSYERNPSLRARNSLSGAEYFFIDRSPMNAGDVLEYRLDEVGFDGTVERLKEIRVEAAFSTIVTDYALDQNYPNPFNPATTIPYQLKDRAKVTLDIYNALGQKIATLVNAEQESGRYAPTFNATALASGMYFYRLQAVGARESFTQTRKMMLVK